MDGLNKSVITGKCPGCADLRAANAALALAGQATIDQRDNMASLDAVYSLDEALDGLRAVLSDTGKGEDRHPNGD